MKKDLSIMEINFLLEFCNKVKKSHLIRYPILQKNNAYFRSASTSTT